MTNMIAVYRFLPCLGLAGSLFLVAQLASAQQGAETGVGEPKTPSQAPAAAPESVSGQPSASPAEPGSPAVLPDSTDEDTDPRALSYFNEALEPNGYWIEDANYGRVWVPYSRIVGPDFAPYVTSGHWELDEFDNWVWVSDYPFGWVVFHYGRWVWVAGTGWAWVPGFRYAPAWVVWRVPASTYAYSSWAYVGWAPLPPYYGWYGGVAVTLGFYPWYPFVFCPSVYVFSHHVHHHVVRHPHRVARIARHTRTYHRPQISREGSAQAIPRGPSMGAAYVPRDAVPKQRLRADPRSVRVTASSRLPASSVRAPAASSSRGLEFRRRDGSRRIDRGQVVLPTRIPSASRPTGSTRVRVYAPRPAQKSTSKLPKSDERPNVVRPTPKRRIRSSGSSSTTKLVRPKRSSKSLKLKKLDRSKLLNREKR